CGSILLVIDTKEIEQLAHPDLAMTRVVPFRPNDKTFGPTARNQYPLSDIWTTSSVRPAGAVPPVRGSNGTSGWLAHIASMARSNLYGVSCNSFAARIHDLSTEIESDGLGSQRSKASRNSG